jgi:hypothetical protein
VVLHGAGQERRGLPTEEITLMNTQKGIAAFTSICAEDAKWVPSYLSEIRRLDIPFFVHFDRCSDETKKLLVRYCFDFTRQTDPRREFVETDKQGVFDLVVRAGFRWAMAFDVDEVFEKYAPEKLQILANVNDHPDAPGERWDWLNSSMFNCWGDTSKIRVDEPFHAYKRARFFALDTGHTWKFVHKTVNGPKSLSQTPTVEGKLNIVCLHLGLMTREDRLHHKERWDRIYTKAVGRNPYNYWNHLCREEEYPPTLIDNPYL